MRFKNPRRKASVHQSGCAPKKQIGLAILAFAFGFFTSACITQTQPAPAPEKSDQRNVVESSRAQTPAPPWQAGDERGMANTQGPGTWQRCAFHMAQPGAQVYELSHERSNTMPVSPFGVPLDYSFRPTGGLPYSMHATNGDRLTGEPGAQGTQLDALGHFGFLDEVWTGTPPFPSEKVRYYGGFTQAEVKPTPDSPLQKLGVENVPPIVTSAVLLDARTHLGGGEPLAPGRAITRAEIGDMLEAQGLAWRGLLPGDVLFIYTGWSEHWADPDTEKIYYTRGPGLAYDAALYLGEAAVVLVALDNPFTDPAAEGLILGKAAPAEGTPEGLPFAIHHHDLTQSGIHQIQNARLAELARDRVWTSCTMILPLRTRGASGSPVRPVAIGAPQQ